MSYFDDILDDAHNRMDVDAGEPGKVDDPKAFAFKVKSSGKDGLKLSQGIDMVASKGAWAFKTKTEAQKKLEEEHALKFTAKNKDYEAQWNFSPADLNKDGQNVDLQVNANCNPSGKKGAEVDLNTKLAFGGFGNDSVKSWTEVEANTDLTKLQNATASQNIAIKSDDQTYHLGAKATWSNESKKAEEIYGQLVGSGFSWGTAWARVAMMNSKDLNGQFVSVGASDKDGKDCEVTYDLSKKMKGFYGLPLAIATGTERKYGKIQQNVRVTLMDEWKYRSTLKVPAGDGFTLTYSDKADLKKLLTPKDAWYKCGLAVELKL